MRPENIPSTSIPLFISQSRISTEVNKTGSWRYARPVYDQKTAPCSAECPAGEDIGRILMLATQGLYQEAWETILMENPFPSVCGRVCYYPCEGVCNRTQLDEPVAIHRLERFVGDKALLDGYRHNLEKHRANGKNVAVLGAGPAGLSAAYFLTGLGYKCDVFEAQSEPGGVLRWGIPGYRLPPDVLKNEIRRIENLGVTIRCETSVTERFFTEVRDRYDAIFTGFGHSRSIQMNIPGEEMASDGLAFLFQIRKGETVSAPGTASVIGGGNTAIDVARSLVRLGATTILMYRRRIQDMPAFKQEVEMAVKEGVKVRELIAPVRIEEESGGLVLTMQKMKPAGTGPDGRTRSVPDGTKTEAFNIRKIFSAIGAQAGQNWHLPPAKKTLNLSHCTIVDKELPVIFGGDLTNSNRSVTHAIASGKQAAIALDALFKNGWRAIEETISNCRLGDGLSLSMESYIEGERKTRNPHIVSFSEINTDYFPSSSRIAPSVLLPDESIKSFSEVDRPLAPHLAMEEAKRCFNCGICNACGNCRLFCPEMAVTLEDTRQIDLDYCKGCGVCVVECPRSVMALVEEKI